MIFSKEDRFLLIKILKNDLESFYIYDKEQIIKLFKLIFKNIKDKYDLSGLFDVYIYSNNEYGMIIEINNLCYFDNEIELKLKIQIDSLFFMEIMSNEILEFDEVYYYKDKFYSYYNDSYDRKIIYKDIDEIINNGIKIC